MTRPIALVLTCAACVACWIGLAQLAMHLARRVTFADAPAILAAILLIGGVSLLVSGGMLRHAGVRLIDHASGFAVADAGRTVVIVGAVVLGAGSGALATIAVMP